MFYIKNITISNTVVIVIVPEEKWKTVDGVYFFLKTPRKLRRYFGFIALKIDFDLTCQFCVECC